MIPKFSILIPTIPNRLNKQFQQVLQVATDQVGDKNVEILALLDNKKRSIGLKRDALVQSARGDYLAFLDDDDHIEPNYVEEIYNCIETNPDADVIVFNQQSTINGGNPFVVKFGIEYENEEAGYDEAGVWKDITRKPFHICVWKTTLAQSERFPDASYGEDWHWAKRLIPKVAKQVRIDKVLHHYRFDDKVTEAELTFPED